MPLSPNDNETTPSEELDDEVDSSLQLTKSITIKIPENLKGLRLDASLAAIIPEISRSKLTNWIKDGCVLVDKKILKPKDKVLGNEMVEITAIIEEHTDAKPENIPLEIVFEDDSLMVINKPRDFVVHPGNGNWHGTIMNAVLYHNPNAQYLARAGIVHRLDKDTTGLMVIAKTDLAQINLVKQLENRTVSRIYRAIVHGHPDKNGIVNKNIGRDSRNRIKMAATEHGGRPSVTNYRVIEYLDNFSYIECKLETGRTHQIRVHLKSIGFPIVGDPLYGSPKTQFAPHIMDAIAALDRQALHALKLSFVHPITEKKMEFRSKIPRDMRFLLSELSEKEPNFADDYKEDTKFIDDYDEDTADSTWEIIYAK